MPREFGYWLNEGEWVHVRGNHLEEILEEPERYGFTVDTIQEVYARYGEEYGREGRSRDELFQRAAEHGWVRVRKYTTPTEYISIQADDLDVRMPIIRDFLIHMVTSGRLATDDTVVLATFRGGEVRTYDWRNGGIGALLQI